VVAAAAVAVAVVGVAAVAVVGKVLPGTEAAPATVAVEAAGEVWEVAEEVWGAAAAAVAVVAALGVALAVASEAALEVAVAVAVAVVVAAVALEVAVVEAVVDLAEVAVGAVDVEDTTSGKARAALRSGAASKGGESCEFWTLWCLFLVGG